jgi:two-component system sensor histidine kinase BaeS
MILGIILLVAVVAGLSAFELVMQPSSTDRITLGALLASYALAVVLIRRWTPPLLSRITGLSNTILLVAVGSVVIAATAVGAAASLMFISSHDLRLVLILLGFGAVLSAGFALAVTRPLTNDLDQLGNAADRVALGELATRSGVTRGDEVGDLARAFDKMAAQLEEATATRSRLENARRRLFTEIGHDLRTPLAALKAATEALEDGIAEDPGRYLKVMRHDLDAVEDLVDDLFLIARMESGGFEFEKEAVDLAELAEETVEGLSPIAERNRVDLRVATPGHAVVKGGPAQLARVIRNLVQNAVQHAPPGSEVLIDVSPGERSTVLRVVDVGRGFTPDQADHAFDRFATWEADRGEGERAGLGLAIARGLIDAHEGRIWIEPGPGGRIGFEIPSGPTMTA